VLKQSLFRNTQSGNYNNKLKIIKKLKNEAWNDQRKIIWEYNIWLLNTV